MKKVRRLLALLLASAMMFGLAGCGGNAEPTAESSGASSSEAAEESSSADAGSSTGDSSAESSSSGGTESNASGSPVAAADRLGMEYDDMSAQIYDDAFGEFYELYEDALADDTNVSTRWAKMAVAEAKMLESAVMLPLSTNGGMYGISRIAPYTNSPVLWGTDSYRYYQRVVTEELITSEDRTAMREHWNETHGDGTYIEWVKQYLTDQGYTIKDEMNVANGSDPVTWDCLATSLQADSEKIIHTYDGLLEYDVENQLQPALAESYEVSDDGLTYTFHIREGVNWVDSQGREIAPVVADDWVAGMQHMCDAMGGLEYLVQGIIAGVNEYILGEITDFSEVGVRAVDDYTLEYTLEAPTSYFLTMISYSIFAPMCRSYYESQGGKFGADFDSSATDYNYGKGPDSIAYCGPFLVTSFVANNSIVYQANDSYWNPDAINIHTMTWKFDSGDDAMKGYNDTLSSDIDGCTLTPARLEQAKIDTLEGDTETVYEKYNYTSTTDATSFMGFFNLARGTWANFNDSTVMISSQTEGDASRTFAAMNNVHFRRAVAFSLDRGSYNAQVVGDDLKLNSLRNGYTPGNFVTLEEDVTVQVNGTDTTFPAGTNYGEIVQAVIDADGVQIKVYDPEGDEGAGSSDGFDGWYNPEAAMEELQTAIEELSADGVEISADNPIHLDLPYPANNEQYTNRANAFKQSLESALGGAVILDLVAGDSFDDWYYAGYYPTYGYEGNYDMNDVSGWSPDYGDPQSYLDTLLPDYAGYMVKAMGIF